MTTFRCFISDYCALYGFTLNNMLNDTFVDVSMKTACFSVYKRGNKVTFRCNKALLRFTIVGCYLTCNI